MPYDTRRKSLSLPSLGIHLPVSHAARAAARLSPPSPSPSPSSASNSEHPPSKKIKRSHESPSMSFPAKRGPLKYENTPPPSPEAEADDDAEGVKPREIDWEEISDDIVEAVIVQLQKTGNRPHLVKELAAILCQRVKIVEQSANPSAIISSRLSSYIKRPWTAIRPCPVAKELETVHPRRTYYYLTTFPHRPIPDLSNREYIPRTIISPSISSAASRSDEAEAERRRELSPSPEVDLSSLEFDDEDMMSPLTPSESFSNRTSHLPRNNRATSPPLEKDEKEFTQTARGMQSRKLSDVLMGGVPSEMEDQHTKNMDTDPLFGRHLTSQNAIFLFSSPAMMPSLSLNTLKRNFEESSEFSPTTNVEWDMRCPENVELDELDGMFDDL